MTGFVLLGVLKGERRLVGSCWKEKEKGWNPFQQLGPKAHRLHDQSEVVIWQENCSEDPKIRQDVREKQKSVWAIYRHCGIPYFFHNTGAPEGKGQNKK